MASDKATTLLASLPLEVRHNIFYHTAARQTKPKKLLRYWFEKKETKELVAKHVADNPDGPAPQVVYHQEREVDSEPEPEAEENEAEEDSENEDEENEEDDDDDNDNGENEDDEADQDGDDDVDAEGGEEEEDEEAMDENDGTHVTDTGTSHAQTSVPAQSVAPQATSATQAQAQTASVDQDDEAGSGAEEVRADHDNAEVQDGDGDAVMADEEEEDASDDGEEDEGEENTTDATADATTSALPPPPPPPAVVISPHHKWHHIPKFMRISHCPPPIELLLASKQLHEEAKNWFYDVAVLRISATSSFAHTSFFEEAFSQITEAAFSPMENIRKVEVLFVWDTTWLRAEETGCAEAIFPALLRQRGDFVHQILSQAPDLREVTIHWHDSAQDNESANFMVDILAPFHSLNANVQIKEHYIAANAKPHKNSIAGQRRVEFQHIVDAGLDRLF